MLVYAQISEMLLHAQSSEMPLDAQISKMPLHALNKLLYTLKSSPHELLMINSSTGYDTGIYYHPSIRVKEVEPCKIG